MTEQLLCFILGLYVSYFCITESQGIMNSRIGFICIVIVGYIYMNKNKQENFIQEQLTEKEKINKSIFYFMFAPWCGYSKKVLPVWEELV